MEWQIKYRQIKVLHYVANPKIMIYETVILTL